jgi:hypothetical protein
MFARVRGHPVERDDLRKRSRRFAQVRMHRSDKDEVRGSIPRSPTSVRCFSQLADVVFHSFSIACGGRFA